MYTKRGLSDGAAISITLVFLILAMLYSALAIGINGGRITHLLQIEGKIQNVVSQVARVPGGLNDNTLQTELVSLNKDRDRMRDEVNYGRPDFHGIPFRHCLLPTGAGCFLKNASEHNNMFIAVASGIMGACLFTLLQARRRPTGDPVSLLGEVVCLLPIGAAVGLLALYLLRGTKGALLSPISEVVQIENPYGIAFLCTVAALFSDRLLSVLTALWDRVARSKAPGQQQEDKASKPSPG